MYLRPVAAHRDVFRFLGRGSVAAVLLALWLGAPPPASARLNGILTSGCNACHTGNGKPSVSISIEPETVALNATVLLTVRIDSPGPAGFYLYSFGKGTFKEPGPGARLATSTDVIHASPKGSTGGEVTFQVAWTAPGTQGTVNFEALGVAANGDRNPGGDSSGQGRLSVAIGCEGVERFVDTDRDGFGTMALPKEKVCDGTAGYSVEAGDCNDYLDYAFPGAEERCNRVDDDCDGQVDEGLDSAVVYRDSDGDGYGDRFTTDTKIGCAASGYAPNKDDCNDQDKSVHPGVREVCNNKDDDCNGRSDEGARAACGLGWCRRNADGCDARVCTPGAPRAEVCNLFDDDCDGVLDNDATCEPGKVCFGGRCLMGDDARAAAEAQAMTTDGGAGSIAGGDGGAPSPGETPPPPGEGAPPAISPGDSMAKPSSLWGCHVAADGRAPSPGAIALVMLLAGLALIALGRSRSR
jgi:hypothetical protein